MVDAAHTSYIVVSVNCQLSALTSPHLCQERALRVPSAGGGGSRPALTMDDELAGVPSFSTGATFFDANAQAHHVPLSAFGDLTDNASEAGASRLLIAIEDSSSSSSNLAISMTDDGCGMSEHKLRTGIGGIGHSDKGGRSEDHCALA